MIKLSKNSDDHFKNTEPKLIYKLIINYSGKEKINK